MQNCDKADENSCKNIFLTPLRAHIITSGLDQKEIKKFEQMAAEWWDSQGKFKPLHHMNPCRLDYIIKQIEIEFNRSTTNQNAFNGIDILDIGCGGGLFFY